MRWTKTLSMIEAHAEGEVGRIVTGGVLDVPGDTMLAKMRHLNEVDDTLRRFCVFEPRGVAQMSTNLIFPPCDPRADAGMIVLQGDRAHAMSGSNSICAVTVLLETGMVEMTEPETIVTLDTPAGLVVATADCQDGKCRSVSLNMTAGFVERLDHSVDVDGLGVATVDIAFGGVYYALIDPRPLGLRIAPDQARALVDVGSRIHRALTHTVPLDHPLDPALNHLAYVMFTDRAEEGELQSATILPPGRIDRSPCGTGNTAWAAVRHARGAMSVGEVDVARSIIGSRFEVKLIKATSVGDRRGVRIQVTGRGWIHGMRQIGLDPTDPYPQGYFVADCWGDATDLLI